MNILSAISAIGTLGFEDLNKIIICGNSGASNYEAKQKRRDLYALGHLEIDYKKRKVNVLRPALCPLPKKNNNDQYRVVLVGFRNKEFMERLLKEAAKRKINVQQDSNQEYPDRILMYGEHNEIQRLAYDLKDYYLHSFSGLSGPTAWRLLHQLESVSHRIEQHLQIRQPVCVYGEIKNLMVYSPENKRYLPWASIRDSYKWSLMLIRKTIYKHWLGKKNSNGNWEIWQNDYQGDLLYVKWAIIQSLDNFRIESLFGAEREKLSVPIDYPLPQEYHRVACLCTGLVPCSINGRIFYHEIPEVIRLEMLNKLRYLKK
jgi:hypothetical protein